MFACARRCLWLRSHWRNSAST